MGGGQSRMYHLYRHVASELGINVTLLVLAPPNTPEQCRDIAPGLTEHRVPLSRSQARQQQQLQAALGVPVDDIAAIHGWRDNPVTLNCCATTPKQPPKACAPTPIRARARRAPKRALVVRSPQR